MRKLLIIALILLPAVCQAQESMLPCGVTITPPASLPFPAASGSSGIFLKSSSSLDGAQCSEIILSTDFTLGVLTIIRRSTCTPFAVPAIACFPGPCDYTIRKVFKDIYKVENGKMTMKTVEGVIVPTQQERIEWPKE